MDAMQDLLPMLKNTSKISPIEGWRLDWGLRLELVV
jgi:hypothetical protein